MLKERLFTDSELNFVKKCVLFYVAIGKTTNRSFDEILKDFKTKINMYKVEKIPQYLSSTLRKNDKFSLIEVVNLVEQLISQLVKLNEKEINFINEFENGNYRPELLFEDQEIIDRLKNHPMALRKILNKD